MKEKPFKKVLVSLGEEAVDVLHFFKKKGVAGSAVVNLAVKHYYEDYVAHTLHPRMPVVTADGEPVPGPFENIVIKDIRIVPERQPIQTGKGEIDVPGVSLASDLPKNPDFAAKAKAKLQKPIDENEPIEEYSVEQE